MIQAIRSLPRARALSAVGAGIFAVLILGALLGVDGISPVDGYRAFFDGAFGSSVSIGTMLTSAVPYIMTALAFTLAFKCRLFNIGLEGQLLWGALAAAEVGIHVDIPGLGIVLAMLAGGIVGGLWALPPILLKLWSGASEIVSSLFLNYIAFYLVAWLVGGPLKQPGSPSATTPTIHTSAQLPSLVANTQITIGVLLAIATAVAVWTVLGRSRLGFKIRTIGANERVAKTVGMDVRRTLVITFVTSGVIGGLAGALEVLGNQYAVAPGFSSGWGYTGIAAALLGGASAAGCVIGGLFFGVLDAGGQNIQLSLSAPSSLAQVSQAMALVVLIVGTALGARFIARRNGAGSAGRRVVAPPALRSEAGEQAWMLDPERTEL